MKFFVQLSNGCYCSYEGMSQDVLEAMLIAEGFTFTYMTEEDFKNAVVALV